MSAVELLQPNRGLVLPTHTGITPATCFPSSAEITDKKAAQAITLAVLGLPSFREKPALHESMMELAKAWLIMNAHSTRFATLPEGLGLRRTVIFGKYDIAFNKRLVDIDGKVEFETVAAGFDPEKGRGGFVTEGYHKGVNIATARAMLVFEQFPFEKLEGSSNGAAKSKQAAVPVAEQPKCDFVLGQIHQGQDLPRIKFDITRKKGMRTAAFGDMQGLHNPWLQVKRDENGKLIYDETGNIATYLGRRQSTFDRYYGDLTRFGRPIPHGVQALLSSLMGLARLSELSGKGAVVTIKKANVIFTGPNIYGATLMIDERVTDIQPNNPLVIGGNLDQGLVTTALTCSTRGKGIIQGELTADLVPLI